MALDTGADQVELSSSYDKRQDEGILRNYGKLLLSLAQHVPDGMIVFFVSYISMEQMISFWNRERSVSCHDIAGIWVAFFSRLQRYHCGQAAAG